MKYRKIGSALLLVPFLFIGMNTLAQEKKADKKIKAAQEVRFQDDYNYAQYQRSSANSNLNYWIGYKISELIAKWGAPTRTASDGVDGQIVVYENFKSGTTGSYTPAYVEWNQYGGITDYRAAQDNRSTYSYTDYWEVSVDKNKTITKIKNGRK